MQTHRLSISASLFLSLWLLASPAAAGTQHGFITKIYSRASDGLVFFFLSGTPTQKPSCATRTYWMIRDETSLAGKQQLVLLMAAYIASTPVTIVGAHTCLRWSDGEDVNLVVLE